MNHACAVVLCLSRVVVTCCINDIMVVISLLCSSGSVVVTYEVVVPKNESTVIQSNIITAIKKHNGSFAGSAIDGNYVSITGKIFI